MLMIGKQLTAEQRLTRAVIDIMDDRRYKALAGVLMIGKKSVSDSVPTAATNGRDEIYGRAFIEKMNDASLRFVILHENYHKLYQHLITWRHLYDEDPATANKACDYVINLKISDECMSDKFATMPMQDGVPMGLLDERFRGMDAAQVFNILRREKQQQQQQEQQSGQGQGQGQPQQQEQQGHQGEPGEPGKQDQSQTSQGAGLDDHDWAGAQAMSEEQTKALAREIDEAVRQGVLTAGRTGSGGERELNEILQAKIDWREVLREFVKTTCAGHDYSTWRRPNRKYVGMGIYLPSGVTEQVGEIVVAIDTSGSIGGVILGQFLGEIAAICETVKPSCLRLLYWDTSVVADEKYVGDEIANVVRSTKPAGGGGTNVTCVPNYMHKNNIKPQAVTVLTDGLLGNRWGTWTVPVLWCIYGSRNSAPVGKTVHIRN
jgi:predicted metal-dependent peptidase